MTNDSYCALQDDVERYYEAICCLDKMLSDTKFQVNMTDSVSYPILILSLSSFNCACVYLH